VIEPAWERPDPATASGWNTIAVPDDGLAVKTSMKFVVRAVGPLRLSGSHSLATLSPFRRAPAVDSRQAVSEQWLIGGRAQLIDEVFFSQPASAADAESRPGTRRTPYNDGPGRAPSSESL